METAKIGIISLGCAKNQVDSEHMLAILDEAGYELMTELDGADVVLINTCGFIESAKSEAIENIIEVGQLKKEGRVKKIIVAGCLAERYRDELIREMPEIDAVLGCGSYHEIASVVEKTLKGENPEVFGDIESAPLEESRILTTPSYTAYLKIAEGCNNRCAYCVIPSLRGNYRSRRFEDIIDEAKGLVKLGTRELIVIAQDTSRYGEDLYGKRKLAELLTELCKIDGLRWLRLHYLYPDEIDDELIDVIAREDKIVKYLDIPIQHVNDRILTAMNRRGSKEFLGGLFTKLRKRIDGLVLRTSLIVGLPGETDAEFEELCNFLKKHKIERAGVFPYSAEEGSLAAKMPDQVEESVKERRCELVCTLQSRIMDEYNRKLIGKELEVLCEGYDRNIGYYFGRSFADSPEIDAQLFFKSDTPRKSGEFITVKITEELDGELLGKAN